MELLLHTNWSEYDKRIQKIRGRTVIDVGAHEGGFVHTFLEHGASRVIAIEPSPRLAEALQIRFWQDPVTVHQCGLSDTPGVLKNVRFYNCWTIAEEGSLKGRASDLSTDGQKSQPEPFDVKLITLDGLVETLVLDPIAFIKIDVDGYEPQVLRGAQRTLETQRPDVYIELSYLPHELGEDIEKFIAWIYDAGYVIMAADGRRFTKDQVLLHFPWNTSLDVFMVPVESVG